LPRFESLIEVQMGDVRGWVKRVASDEDIEGVVLALRAVHHKSAWERVLDAGRVVFERIVGGNEAEWRSHRGRKSVSLRKLVQHAKCPFKKSAIYLFVQLEPSVRRMPGITPTHVTQTLSMDAPRALELLRKAANAEWSSRELGQRVRQLRKVEGERRGRPASSEGKRAGIVVARAARALREMREQLASCNMSEDSLRELHRALDELSELVADVRALPSMARRSGMVLLSKAAPRADPEAATG
jgi:hypothetical protein